MRAQKSAFGQTVDGHEILCQVYVAFDIETAKWNGIILFRLGCAQFSEI